MLRMLEKYLADNTILRLLDDRRIWDSLVINRRKPYTYRMFTQLGENRVCLHRFETCNEEEAFFHPHPWPGAFKILKGSYKMKIGHSKDRVSEPEDVADFILTAGSSYEIVNPLTWHSVVPLETTYTIMINGPAWENAHEQVRTTKGKDLGEMAYDELVEQIRFFRYNLGIEKDK